MAENFELAVNNISANFCAEYEKRRNPEVHSLYSWSKTIMEIRLGKLRNEEHIARMYIFINALRLQLKSLKWYTNWKPAAYMSY